MYGILNDGECEVWRGDDMSRDTSRVTTCMLGRCYVCHVSRVKCHRDTFGFFMLHKTTAQMRLHVIRGECLHRRRYLCSFKWWDNHHRDNKSRRVPPSIKTRLCVRDRDSLRRHGSRSASWQRHVSIASCHYRNSQIIVTIHHLSSVDNLPQIF